MQTGKMRKDRVSGGRHTNRHGNPNGTGRRQTTELDVRMGVLPPAGHADARAGVERQL